MDDEYKVFGPAELGDVQSTATLSDLDHITADTVLETIRQRFYAAQPYTAVSHSVLVSVNPHGSVGTHNDDETLRQYTSEFRALSREQRLVKRPPHVFQIAADAYYYMYRTGQDQSIVMV